MKCQRCQQTVPDKAETCPYCGIGIEKGVLARIIELVKPLLFPTLPGEGPGPESIADMPPESPFKFTVEDVSGILGLGVIATGTVQMGTITIGQRAKVSSRVGGSLDCRIMAIEKLQESVETASQGEKAGLLLSDISKDDIAKGDTITNSPS